MNLEMPCGALLAPLLAAAGAVEARQTMPILSNALMVLSDGALAITASDASMEISVTVPARYSGEARTLTAPLRKLAAILRELPADAGVALELRGTRLRISTEDATFNLQTLPATEFPRMTAAAGGVEITLPARALRSLLETTQYAKAERGAVQFFLTGALLAVGPDGVVVVCRDYGRQAVARYATKLDVPPTSAILPPKTVGALTKLLAHDDEVRVRLQGTLVVFEFGSTTVSSGVLAGLYPDFEKPIPALCARRFVVDRPLLLRALLRAGVLAGRLRGCRWNIGGERLCITAISDDKETVETAVAITYVGEAFSLGFNLDYCSQPIAALQSNQVEIAFGDVGDAMLLRIPGREDDFQYVAMPMKL